MCSFDTVRAETKLSLFMTLRRIGGAEVQLHPFLTLVLDGGE